MNITTEIQRVVQVLLKGDDYDVACPNGEDMWYSIEDFYIDDNTTNTKLIEALGNEVFMQLSKGEIDYVVARGNW